MSVTTAELPGVTAPQSRHLPEACCTNPCKLIGVVLHSISLCPPGKSADCDGLAASHLLHALSCLQEGYLHIMPEVSKVSGGFFLLFVCREV